MTNSGNQIDPRLARRKGWASAQLNVALDASPDQVEATFLQRLRDDDFVPDESLLTAFKTMTESDADCVLLDMPDSYRFNESLVLEEQIGAFAKEMFRCSPAERLRQWQQLRLECQDVPRMLVRLDGLKPGLALDASAHIDSPPLVRRLGDELLKLFVLTPTEKAVRRSEILASIENELPDWEDAARTLIERFPDLRELDTQFVDELAYWSNWASEARDMRSRTYEPRVVARHSGDGRGINMFIWMFVFFIAMAVLGTINNNRSDSTSPYMSPSYSPPKFDPTNTPGLTLKPEQVREMFDMDDEELRGSSGHIIFILSGLDKTRRHYRAILDEIRADRDDPKAELDEATRHDAMLRALREQPPNDTIRSNAFDRDTR